MRGIDLVAHSHLLAAEDAVARRVDEEYAEPAALAGLLAGRADAGRPGARGTDSLSRRPKT
jgi:hypothetical protein